MKMPVMSHIIQYCFEELSQFIKTNNNNRGGGGKGKKICKKATELSYDCTENIAEKSMNYGNN